MADIPPLAFDQGYFDAELWVRLRPRIEEKRLRLAETILGGTLTTYDSYREHVGQYTAWTEVLKEAAHLTRVETTETEDE